MRDHMWVLHPTISFSKVDRTHSLPLLIIGPFHLHYILIAELNGKLESNDSQLKRITISPVSWVIIGYQPRFDLGHIKLDTIALNIHLEARTAEASDSGSLWVREPTRDHGSERRHQESLNEEIVTSSLSNLHPLTSPIPIMNRSIHMAV